METIQRHLVDQIIENFPKFDNKSNTEIKELLSSITEEYTIKLNHREDDVEDLKEKINLFIEGKTIEGLAETTLVDYRRELNLFAKVVKVKTHQITSNDIRRFLTTVKDLKRSTTTKKLQVLKSFFGWLTNEEVILSNPAIKVKTPKPEQRADSHFSIRELELLRDHSHSLRSRALIEILYSSGVRLSEVSNIKIEHLNLSNLSFKVVGKGNKERIVYFTERALHHINAYLESRDDECEYLFITERRPCRKMSNDSIGAELKKVRVAAGIERSITPHDYRRSFSTHALDKHVDLVVIQHLLGHSKISTTQLYAKLSETRKEYEYRRVMSQ